MASEKTHPDTVKDALCMPCDGRGTVISNLGGAPQELPCPWCEGTGKRVPGIDAQARFLAQRERDGSAAAGALDGRPGENGAALPPPSVQPSNHD